MIPAVEQEHLAHRKARADSFIAAPERWKVCDQCQSVWLRERGTCLICGAYRWDESMERLVAVAHLLGSTPFPFTAGTVPRF